MAMSGLILGIINIAIVIVVLVFVGAIALWFATLLKWPPPENVQKLYLAVVALIALYMIVALVFGIPTIRIIS